jgi:hypothetical protein
MACIALVSCVSRKGARRAKAKDLYDSPLFKKARDYAETCSNTWYILSAKYGLLTPDTIIAPYDDTLNTKSRAERQQWAERVWRDLSPRVQPSDRIVILAGQRYREFILPKLVARGCVVDVPMEGLGIGRQLGWLSGALRSSSTQRNLARLYRILDGLELGLGGRRLMSECCGQQRWPKGGVYFFFEPGETRSDSRASRIVRVGTHGVSRGSNATLWNRLRTHRGTADGLGNHRSSIFRLHVGAALVSRDPHLAVASWGIGQAVSANIQRRERDLERAVSRHIGSMSVLWLAVEGEAGPSNDRAYLERNLIGLLTSTNGPADPPSPDWLGRCSPNRRIRQSGLWNLDFLAYPYADEFLDVLEQYVLITLGRTRQPAHPIAPPRWYLSERQGVPRSQLPLFPD